MTSFMRAGVDHRNDAESRRCKQPPSSLQAPIHQHRFRRRRIGLDAGNSHPLQSDVAGNLADIHGAGGQERLHLVELLARKRRLAASVSGGVVRLGMRDSGSLRVLCGLGLGLGGPSHERNQAILHGLLDGISRGAVEGEAIDDGLDDDAALDEALNSLDHIVAIAAKQVDPAHHEGVAAAKQVNEAPAFRPLAKPGRNAGRTVVSNNVIGVNVKTGGTGLGKLM
jgi:hypothetical protein